MFKKCKYILPLMLGVTLVNSGYSMLASYHKKPFRGPVLSDKQIKSVLDSISVPESIKKNFSPLLEQRKDENIDLLDDMQKPIDLTIIPNPILQGDIKKPVIKSPITIQITEDLFQKALQELSENNDKETLTKIRAKGFEISHSGSVNPNEEELLIKSISFGLPNTLKILVEKGADLNKLYFDLGEREQKSILGLSFSKIYGAKNMQNCVEIIDYLLGKEDINLNIQDAKGNTPLFYISEGIANCVNNANTISNKTTKINQLARHFKILIENGAKLSIKNQRGINPLHKIFLVINEDSVINVLQDIVSEVRINREDWKNALSENSDLGTPFHIAISRMNQDTFDYIISLLESIDTQTIEGGNLNIIRDALLDSLSIYSSKDEKSLLHEVIYNFRLSEEQRRSVANYLVENGIDIEKRGKDGYTALHSAIYNKRDSIAELLISFNPQLDNDELNRCFETSIKNGNLYLVRYFISQGADLNSNDPERNPLHLAALSGNHEVYELIESNLQVHDINEKDNNGNSLLHSAAIGGSIEILDRLWMAGLNINEPNYVGDTPLHMASHRGHLNVVQSLIDKEAIINTRNREDQTPLHYASMNEHFEVIKSLINKGAEINAKDIHDYTPLDYAPSAAKNIYLTEFLRSHGAKKRNED